ncbi:hypothetical protein AGOR_G00227170 [Albula goreensis]|uniref:histone acetyltransferase n=1 Tax=Albula goreensis TaxID=1534307 RepID=A0A8T3CP66_9TELE|nr:hypothetical protein AGOR_G00227170 [Albula goreensis]
MVPTFLVLCRGKSKTGRREIAKVLLLVNYKIQRLTMDGTVNVQVPANDAERSSELRRLSIQRCIQALMHACQCRNTNCSLASCQKMKRVVQHTKGCKRKTNGGCPICKQLIALCCYHAKHCQENRCPMPFCLKIKHKLRQQQLQHRLQQAQMLRRRMAMRNPRVARQRA